jgi:aspartyl protease family protein
MIIAAWIGVLTLLALLFQGTLERQRAPQLVSSSVDGNVAEVVVERNRSGHYVVEGSVNGRPQLFLVDTGATAVALSQGAARRFQLDRGPSVTLSTANGTVRGYRTRIDSLSVGDIVVRDVAAVVSPGIEDGVALLGMSFLRRLELVQRDGLLLLRQVQAPASS